jgi:hypothetical protein
MLAIQDEYSLRKQPTKRRFNIKWTLCIFLTTSLVLSSGCGDRAGAADLANAGATTANALASYYNSLAQDSIDSWEMEAFYDSIQGIPFDQNSQKLYQDRIDALNHRAQMATDLASLYGALTQLSSYDASGQVSGAADRLSKQLTSIPVLSGSGVNPASLIGSVAGDLADWKQSKDLRKGSRIIAEALEKIERLFQSEAKLYKSIARERGLSVANVLEYMIQNKMVTTTPLLQQVPQSLGLTLTTIPTDDKTTNGVIQLARVRLQRLALLSASAADTTDQSLLLLVQNHKDFQNKKQLSLNQVLTGLQKVQVYLDEISQLRAGQK